MKPNLRAFTAGDPCNRCVLEYHLFDHDWDYTLHTQGEPLEGVMAAGGAPEPGESISRIVGWTEDETVARSMLASVDAEKSWFLFGSSTAMAKAAGERWAIPEDTLPVATLIHDADVSPSTEKIRPLEVREAALVNRFWYLGEGLAEDSLKGKIVRYPSACIERDGEPIAWCGIHFMTQSVANLGFLYVMKPWRRQGLGSELTRHLIHEVRKLGRTPLIHVMGDNPASVSLGIGEGFRQVGEAWWVQITPQ